MLHLFNLNMFDTYEHRRKYTLDVAVWGSWVNKYKPDHIIIDNKLFVVINYLHPMYERLQAYCALMDHSCPHYMYISLMWDPNRMHETLDAVKYAQLYQLTKQIKERNIIRGS